MFSATRSLFLASLVLAQACSSSGDPSPSSTGSPAATPSSSSTPTLTLPIQTTPLPDGTPTGASESVTPTSASPTQSEGSPTEGVTHTPTSGPTPSQTDPGSTTSPLTPTPTAPGLTPTATPSGLTPTPTPDGTTPPLTPTAPPLTPTPTPSAPTPTPDRGCLGRVLTWEGMQILGLVPETCGGGTQVDVPLCDETCRFRGRYFPEAEGGLDFTQGSLGADGDLRLLHAKDVVIYRPGFIVLTPLPAGTVKTRYGAMYGDNPVVLSTYKPLLSSEWQLSARSPELGWVCYSSLALPLDAPLSHLKKDGGGCLYGAAIEGGEGKVLRYDGGWTRSELPIAAGVALRSAGHPMLALAPEGVPHTLYDGKVLGTDAPTLLWQAGDRPLEPVPGGASLSQTVFAVSSATERAPLGVPHILVGGEALDEGDERTLGSLLVRGSEGFVRHALAKVPLSSIERCDWEPQGPDETCEYSDWTVRVIAVATNARGEARYFFARVHEAAQWVSDGCGAIDHEPTPTPCQWAMPETSTFAGELWVGWLDEVGTFQSRAIEGIEIYTPSRGTAEVGAGGIIHLGYSDFVKQDGSFGEYPVTVHMEIGF